MAAAKTGRDSRTQATAPPPWMRRTATGIDLALHVQPGARREGAAGRHGDRLKVALRAPAVDGRANAALIDWLAAQLRLPRRAVELVSGAGSRDKLLRIHAAPDEALLTALAAFDGGAGPPRG